MARSTAVTMLEAELLRSRLRRLPSRTVAVAVVVVLVVMVVMVATNATFHGLAELANVIRGVAVFTSFAAAVIGASLVGAEFSTGDALITMVWQPDRRRLGIAKIVAAAVTTASVAVLIVVVCSITYLLASLVAGAGLQAGDAQVSSIAGATADAVLGAVLIGAIAAAVSLAVRNANAFPIAFFLLYFVGDRLIALAGERIIDVLPATNLMVVTTGDARFASAGLDPAYGLIVSVIWVAVSIVVALAVFDRWEMR